VPILQILTSVVSAIAGSLTNGIIKLFRGKKELPSSPPPPPSPPSQHVLVAGPLALVSLQFALNPEIRDILEIPRGGPEQTSPRLILPGQGIVSVQQFIVEVADTLGMRAERKVECAYCHHERHHGAFANSNWVCLDCFKEHLSHLAEGRPEISSGTLWPARSWSWITQLLNGAQAIRALSSEPTVVALIRASKESSIEVQFNDIWLDHDVAHVDGRAIGIHVPSGSMGHGAGNAERASSSTLRMVSDCVTLTVCTGHLMDTLPLAKSSRPLTLRARFSRTSYCTCPMRSCI
jgi:hypothetical protein